MITAKVFQSGNSQAIRLPKEFRFSGKKVFIRKFGKGVLLEPEYPKNAIWLEEVSNTPDDLFDKRDQPKHVDVCEKL